MTTGISCSRFGTTKNGDSVDQYFLTNSSGIEVGIITYGGIITSLRIPDRQGHFDDVVLGYDSLHEYERCPAHFGCITGRYANRISRGKFSIDDQSYQLETNHGQHHLHGASAGFGKVLWQAEADSDSAALVLRYLSVDGHGGYPGNLQVEVTYQLTDDNQLKIDYRAITDKPTIVNLTNHSYFNLQGHQHVVTDGVLDHQLLILSDSFVPVDEVGIPLGGLHSVDNSPFDFRQATRIGARILDDHEQIENGKGYDHSWVVAGPADRLKPVARVIDSASGRTMNVETTQPGVQFYSCNNLSDHAGKSGVHYGCRGALCLETQYFPDSPNNPDYPQCVVRPNEEWKEQAIFTFSFEGN